MRQQRKDIGSIKNALFYPSSEPIKPLSNKLMAHETVDPVLADLQRRRTPTVNWASLSLGERIRYIEVEGFLLMPRMLDEDQIAQLKRQTSTFSTTAVSYSEKQRGKRAIQWTGGAVTELIAHPPMIDFLKRLFGDSVIMMDYAYARSEPGHPGISLHADGQPWGSKIFGAAHSCPRLIRCLYYLDDLTPEISPFRVVPRSHLSFHNDGNPYLRYERHPGELMITAQAGDAVLINQNVFHGNYPNIGNSFREMLAIAYRPSWAGPADPVEAWPEEMVARCSADVQDVLKDRSQRIWAHDAPDKPDNMPIDAPGIDPERWELK